MAAPKKPARKRIYHRHVQYTQDLFLSDVQDTWKDLGYKGNRIEARFPHRHTFRTVNSKGKTQDRTPTKNGHFHLIEWDPETLEVTKVSEAMTLQAIKNEDGKVTGHEAVPLAYFNRDGQRVKDTHTHSFEYVRSFDYDSLKAQRQQVKDREEYKKKYAAEDVVETAKQVRNYAQTRSNQEAE